MPKKVWKSKLKNHMQQGKCVLVEISSRNFYWAMFKSISFSSVKRYTWEEEGGEDHHLVQISVSDVANKDTGWNFDIHFLLKRELSTWLPSEHERSWATLVQVFQQFWSVIFPVAKTKVVSGSTASKSTTLGLFTLCKQKEGLNPCHMLLRAVARIFPITRSYPPVHLVCFSLILSRWCPWADCLCRSVARCLDLGDRIQRTKAKGMRFTRV